MPAEDSKGKELRPLPSAFLDQLGDLEEILVSSRDPLSQGTVRMWFAVIPPGFIYLLTPTFTQKAARWRDDPWVNFRIPGTRVNQAGVVAALSWEEAKSSAELLTRRFAMSGAATPEALRWMLQDGSRQLLKAGLEAGNDLERVKLVQPENAS